MADRSTDDDDLAAEGGEGAKPFAADFDTAVEQSWEEQPAGGGDGGGGCGAKQKKRACGEVVGIVKRAWRCARTGPEPPTNPPCGATAD